MIALGPRGLVMWTRYGECNHRRLIYAGTHRGRSEGRSPTWVASAKENVGVFRPHVDPTPRQHEAAPADQSERATGDVRCVGSGVSELGGGRPDGCLFLEPFSAELSLGVSTRPARVLGAYSPGPGTDCFQPKALLFAR